MRSPLRVRYLDTLSFQQARVESRIEQALPTADVRWHYSVVLDGMAVVVPARDVDRLASVPGIARVFPSYAYRPQAQTTPQQIHATALWGANLKTAGNGIKIAIV